MSSINKQKARLLAAGLNAVTLITLTSNTGLAQSPGQSRQAAGQSPQYQQLNQQPAQLKQALAPGDPPPGDLGSALSLVVTTTPQIDGYHVRRYLGVVRGVRVFQPTIGESLRAGLKGMIGGNIGAYGEMCEKARQQAYDQLITRSTALGANAVLGLRFDSSPFSVGSSEMGTEVICYGTAVYLEADR